MSNIDIRALLGVPKHANQHRLSRLTMEVHTDELRIMASAVEDYTDELIAALEAAERRIAELEARDVKPVAWRLINSPESSLPVTDNKHIADVWKRNGRDVQALFPSPPVSLVPVGTVLSDGRQMSVHNKCMVVDVVVESGKLIPGDKLYIAAAAGKGE